MEILDQFGVKPMLLAAQVVNFLVLLILLKKFLYKPILKVLEERKKVISQSLQNAAEIEDRLNKIGADREKKLHEAANEAKAIIDDASKSANDIVSQAHAKATGDIERLKAKNMEAMQLEKDKLHQEIRSELAGLIISGLETVTGKVISEKEQKEMIERAVKGVKI